MQTIERRIRTAHRKAAAIRILVAKAKALRDQGFSNIEIAKKLGVTETAIRYITKQSPVPYAIKEKS